MLKPAGTRPEPAVSVPNENAALPRTTTDAEPELVAAGIGRRIKERLNELGMTNHELAIACGIDDKKIELYTIGYTTPKAQTCEKIAEALECSVEWLLGTGGDTE